MQVGPRPGVRSHQIVNLLVLHKDPRGELVSLLESLVFGGGSPGSCAPVRCAWKEAGGRRLGATLGTLHRSRGCLRPL